MIKYVVDSSEDYLRFRISSGELTLHDSKWEAKKDILYPWQHVYKITIEQDD